MGYRKLNAMSVFGTLLIAGTVAACARYQEPSFGNYEVVRHVFTHPISGNHTQWLQLRAEIDPGTTTIGQVRVYYNLHPTRDPATFPSRVATWNPATRRAHACIDFTMLGLLPDAARPERVRFFWRAEYSVGGASDVLHGRVQNVPDKQSNGDDNFGTSLERCT